MIVAMLFTVNTNWLGLSKYAAIG